MSESDLAVRRLRVIETLRSEKTRTHDLLLRALVELDGTHTHLVGLGTADLAAEAARRLVAMRGTLSQHDGSPVPGGGVGGYVARVGTSAVKP